MSYACPFLLPIITEFTTDSSKYLQNNNYYIANGDYQKHTAITTIL